MTGLIVMLFVVTESSHVLELPYLAKADIVKSTRRPESAALANVRVSLWWGILNPKTGDISTPLPHPSRWQIHQSHVDFLVLMIISAR